MEQVTQLYDVKGAAHLLAVSPWTIRAYIRRGKLRPVRLGRLVRLDEQELARFLTSAKATDNDVANSTTKENSRERL